MKGFYHVVMDALALPFVLIVFVTLYRASKVYRKLKDAFLESGENKWRTSAVVNCWVRLVSLRLVACACSLLVQLLVALDIPVLLAAVLEFVTIYRTIPLLSGLKTALRDVKLSPTTLLDAEQLGFTLQGKKMELRFQLAQLPIGAIPRTAKLHMMATPQVWSSAERLVGGTAVSLIRLFLPLTLQLDQEMVLQTNEAGTSCLLLTTPRPSRKQLADVLRYMPQSGAVILILQGPEDQNVVQVQFCLGHVLNSLQAELNLPATDQNQDLPAQLFGKDVVAFDQSERDLRNERIPSVVLQELVHLLTGLLKLGDIILMLVLSTVFFWRGAQFWSAVCSGYRKFRLHHNAMLCRRQVRRVHFQLRHALDRHRSPKARYRRKKVTPDIEDAISASIMAAQAGGDTAVVSTALARMCALGIQTRACDLRPVEDQFEPIPNVWNFQRLKGCCRAYLGEALKDLGGLIGLVLLLAWPIRWVWAYHRALEAMAISGSVEGMRDVGLQAYVAIAFDLLAVLGSVFVLTSGVYTAPFLAVTYDQVSDDGIVGWHNAVAEFAAKWLGDILGLIGHIFSSDFWKTLTLTCGLGLTVIGEGYLWALSIVPCQGMTARYMAIALTLATLAYSLVYPLSWQPSSELENHTATGGFHVFLAIYGLLGIRASYQQEAIADRKRQVHADHYKGFEYSKANLLTVLALLFESSQLFVIPWAALGAIEHGFSSDLQSALNSSYQYITLQFATEIEGVPPSLTFWLAVAAR